MWSGPRNLSTAMMYSFDARADFAVVDEPFYAAYLERTGIDHPMRKETLASQSSDADEVARSLLGSIPAQKSHLYQKHMTQHMVDGVPREWMADVVNVFLIRHPARVVASFAKKYPNVQESDIGFIQQAELFDYVRYLGQEPVVIDSADIRQNPERALKALCAAVNLEWDPSMLSWPEGGNPNDGVWAKHWYDAVHRSTGFAAAEGPLPSLSGRYAKLVESVMPAYESMAKRKLV